MYLWWLGPTPVHETLSRDARLTAAIAKGRAVLASSAAGRWGVLLIEMLIEYSLSAVYAAVAMPLVIRLIGRVAILAGAAYGLAIYGVNLHALSALFPRFSISRGRVTMLVRVIFGMALTGTCSRLRASGSGTPSGA
jgi:hypothetical protein